jgi:hypothetical protein
VYKNSGWNARTDVNGILRKRPALKPVKVLLSCTSFVNIFEMLRPPFMPNFKLFWSADWPFTDVIESINTIVSIPGNLKFILFMVIKIVGLNDIDSLSEVVCC